jgi:hypothetical protein
MREAIELHDSRLLSFTQTEDRVCLKLDAYIHRSPETPGGCGTGWSQEVEFHFDGVNAIEFATTLPLWIMDGAITGSISQDNLIPLPCEINGDLQFEVDGYEGRLTIRATQLRIHRLGEPRFVEETSVDSYPSSEI